jgi:hypothetical protein
MLYLGMHSTVMLRFSVQAFQDPPLCSSTDPLGHIIQSELRCHHLHVIIDSPCLDVLNFGRVWMSWLFSMELCRWRLVFMFWN